MSNMRSRFEAWYSDGGKWPRAIERSGGAYKLAQAQSAWEVWQVAERGREAVTQALLEALREALPYLPGDANDPDGPISKVAKAIAKEQE
jgi:hypothetical protein